MKGFMRLVSTTQTMEREFTTRNNEVRKVKYRMLRFATATDSIYGETSERLTERFDTQTEAKIDLKVGHLYLVDFTLQARDYSKDNKTSVFQSVIITALELVV